MKKIKVDKKLTAATIAGCCVAMMAGMADCRGAFLTPGQMARGQAVGAASVDSVGKDVPEDLDGTHSLIVFYDSATGCAAVEDSVKACGGSIVFRNRGLGMIGVSLPDGVDVREAKMRLRNVAGVKRVELDKKDDLMSR